ncbi:DUF882 domain-containing protein [Desulfuromonas carbonis]|uniref:YcbK family protein n=1 Tax=Desulfuromonas sp. DDH964 TaxID=1823759 RepID=UPI00078D8979|nr:DUF882 domain-containing protein [Desulfuromonas sp. DDH964]AMV73826.1 hypothetical protein DBW_3528 [Desulfuromonas sp. DDH964]
MNPSSFQPCPEPGISRRTLLKAGLLATAGLLLPGRTLASLAAPLVPEKAVSLYNIHTGESLTRAVYWAEGEFIPETLAEINFLLRDYRTGEVTSIEPQLYDLFFALRRKLGATDPFHVISGYRSPATNAMLRATSSGVARHSLHMQGKAADVRLPGVELKTLRKAAISLHRGGVGYYPDSDFVHIDTGRVRSW